MTRRASVLRLSLLVALVGPPGVLALWLLEAVGIAAIPRIQASSDLAFILLIAAPMLEEFAFRGAIQDLCKHVTHDARVGRIEWLTVANVFTSIAFAACHTATQAASLAVVLVLPSLVLGRVRELTDSIVPCILLHSWFNACFMMVFAR